MYAGETEAIARAGVRETHQEAQTSPVVSRRILIAGLVAATAISKTEPAQSLHGQIQEAAVQLATLMGKLHGGGAWYAEINHEGPIVFVGRDLAGP